MTSQPFICTRQRSEVHFIHYARIEKTALAAGASLGGSPAGRPVLTEIKSVDQLEINMLQSIQSLSSWVRPNGKIHPMFYDACNPTMSAPTALRLGDGSADIKSDCYIGRIFTCGLAYADDIILLALVPMVKRKISSAYVEAAKVFHISFDAS